MPVSEATYERPALEDHEGRWEIVCRRPRSKPGMTAEHNETQRNLMIQLATQLNTQDHTIATDNGRLRIPSATYYVPDLCVIPREYVRRNRREQPGRLEVYDEPMPPVVEVWSPSTGDYDIETKLRTYQLRGDAEIWRIHPSERTLTARRHRPDGGYDGAGQREGSVQPIALPGVTIELERLFD